VRVLKERKKGHDMSDARGQLGIFRRWWGLCQTEGRSRIGSECAESSEEGHFRCLSSPGQSRPLHVAAST